MERRDIQTYPVDTILNSVPLLYLDIVLLLFDDFFI